MKKNNRGFTLVELLASIVILGILSVFALPMITGMVEKSRNKMYVSDARKLISLAEYQMKASSSTIEKPDPGDFIVISMHYLDNSVFTSAPNGGEYEIDHSFVVVKNNGGKLEYSASIVEKLKKGGYKGIILTKESNLIKKRAHIDYIHSFTDMELVNVENDINKTYVNKYLGSGYVTGNGAGIYHYHEIDDSNAQIVIDSSPVIDNAEISGNGVLKATLTVKASDKDTSRPDLKVLVSVDSEGSGSQVSYGTNAIYSREVDFSKFGYSYAKGGRATVYITVTDPGGHSAKKTLYYEIKKNVAPTITSASLSNRESDDVNTITATLKVTGADDLDTISKLSFCIKESGKNGATDCSDYKAYSSFFSSTTSDGGSLDYTFKECPGGCRRNGATQYLTLFVKDSMNAISSKVLDYTFSTNQNPQLDNNGVTVNSGPAAFGEGSKDIKVSVSVTDDHDKPNQLKVTISDGVTTKEYPYKGSDSAFDFTLNGDYTGTVDQRTKQVSVYVTDSEGGKSSTVKKSYTLYQNTAPKINSFVITSDGSACNVGKYCSPTVENNITKDGSLNTLVSFSLMDDIEIDNNYGSIKVCFSQEKSDCNNDANFKPYSEYSSLEKIQYELTGSYVGTEAQRTKTVYLKIKDRYGLTAETSSQYVLYEDKGPIIVDDGFVIDSKKASFVTDAAGDISAYIKIVAEDDFDKDDLKFTLKHNGREVISNRAISSLYTLRDTGEVDEAGSPTYTMIFDYLYSVASSYDGSTHQFEAYVTDKNGYRSPTKTFTYKVYKNIAPKAGNASVSPTYNKDRLSLLDVYFNSGITDDIDSSMSMKYCYKIGSGTAHCTNSMTSSGMAHLTTENLFNDITGYNGQTLTLYATATDSGGLSVTSKNVSYTIHKATVPVVKGVTAIYDPSLDGPEEETHTITVSFEVQDSSMGEFTICINDKSTCTEYFGAYENGETYTIPFEYPSDITSTSKIYFYAKNSAGTSTSKSATIGNSDSVNHCKFLLEKPTYQYTAKTSKVISTSDCNNKCYHNNTIIGDNNTYNASYTKKLTLNYYDKLNPESFCSSSGPTTTTETKYCDFKDCFYNKSKNSYKQIVIGSFLFDGSWTINVDGVTYDLDSYYKIYESNYTEGDEDITLTEVNTWICPFCYENGYYGDSYRIKVADFDIGG